MEMRCDVAVVGGGLAGLTAAAAAAIDGASVILLEGRAPGGRATTDVAGRFRFNRGAHALYRGGPAQAVLARLGISEPAAPSPGTDAHGRVGEQVGLLPWGEAALTRTTLIDDGEKPALREFLRTINDWRLDELACRSARDWLDSASLPPTALRFIETQARLVTYVAAFEHVSADLVATQLQLEPVVDYLRVGWSGLVDALAAAARRYGATIVDHASVDRVIADGDRVAVHTDRRRILARRVVLAAGAPAANARLLTQKPAAWAKLGPPLEVAAMDLGLSTVPPRRVLLGFDRPLYLSMHAPPAQLAPPGASVVHLLRYLRPGERLSAEDARAEMAAHADLAGIDASTIETSRYLHRMVVTGGVPLPGHGGMPGRPDVEDTGADGVLIAGDWVGSRGHLADAALASGELAGRTAAAGAARAARVATTYAATYALGRRAPL